MWKSGRPPLSSESPDTIYALSSAPGRAGIAVVRVSGPTARHAAEGLTGRPCPAPRVARLARLIDPVAGSEIDRGLLLWFPAPASVTGEDVAEFHVHGGRAVVEGLFAALSHIPGTRPAVPGEFTRRGFDNGKLDLTEAEGLADLIDAETEAQRRQALRQMEGALGALYEAWRERLVRALAYVEAAIDFPEEELPGDLIERVRPDLAAAAQEMRCHLEDDRRGEIVREGLTVAIIGPPNAGKSSLLNAIAERDAAIVAETPGTTRDVVEVRVDLGGYPVILADTAGIRSAEDEDALDPVEAEGIRRSLARAEGADLTLLVLDGGDPSGATMQGWRTGNVLVVANKSDAPGFRGVGAAGPGAIPVSAKTGEGLKPLLGRLAEIAGARMALGEAPAITRTRHRSAVERAVEALGRALAADAAELLAEDLRLAVRALGEITGRVGVEDLLDLVFRDFCIGK